MTPLERADKVRDALQPSPSDSPMEAEVFAEAFALLPPGSLILTPDEAEKVRRQVLEGKLNDQLLAGKHFVAKDWNKALVLLAGKGQT